MQRREWPDEVKVLASTNLPAFTEDDTCEVRDEPGARPCGRPATRLFREPYTPAGYLVHACDEHEPEYCDEVRRG